MEVTDENSFVITLI